MPDVEVVGDPVDRLPHLVTFSCLYVDGEALVDRARPARVLGRERLGVHLVHAWTPSRVLAAMGALTHGNVRLSLTRDATGDDVDAFLAALPEVVRRHPSATQACEHGGRRSSSTAAACSARCR